MGNAGRRTVSCAALTAHSHCRDIQPMCAPTIVMRGAPQLHGDRNPLFFAPFAFGTRHLQCQQSSSCPTLLMPVPVSLTES